MRRATNCSKISKRTLQGKDLLEGLVSDSFVIPIFDRVRHICAQVTVLPSHPLVHVINAAQSTKPHRLSTFTRQLRLPNGGCDSTMMQPN